MQYYCISATTVFYIKENNFFINEIKVKFSPEFHCGERTASADPSDE
jgi:hypothetical protein